MLQPLQEGWMDVLAAPPPPSDTLEKCITFGDKRREGRERERERGILLVQGYSGFVR